MSLPAIRPIYAAELKAIDPIFNFPTVAEAGVDKDGDVVCIGGLSWRFDRCWLWYRIIDRNADVLHPHLVVGTARRMLRRAAGQLGEPIVYAWRDESEPSSRRLLQVLGFNRLGRQPVKMTDGTEQDREVWSWQIPSHGPRSQPSAP